MKQLAKVFEEDVLGGRTVPEDFSKGLLELMEKEGYDMLPVIVNHPSLAPPRESTGPQPTPLQ